MTDRHNTAIPSRLAVALVTRLEYLPAGLSVDKSTVESVVVDVPEDVRRQMDQEFRRKWLAYLDRVLGD